MSRQILIISKSDDWILDDEGDVMLVVGKLEPCRIRVSAKVLSLASDVFKAMFSPRFREGSSLRSAGNRSTEPIIITLPEDDPAAMLSLCQLLHCQIDMVDPHPDTTTLLGLATVCDKYDCVPSMRYASRIWLDPLVDSTDASSLNDLLVASYLFDSAEVFTKVSCKLLEKWTGSFKELIRDGGGVTLPTSIYVALDEQSDNFHYHMERSLQEMFVEVLNDEAICSGGRDSTRIKTAHIGTCVETFVEIGFWPISRTPRISTTLKQLEGFPWESTLSGCGESDCPVCLIDFKPQVKKIRKDARRQIQGFCLDCVRHDGYNPGVCRVPHTKESDESLTTG